MEVELRWDDYETATIMYKLKNHIAPDHLAQMFDSKNSIHSYNLRNSKHNLFVPRPYTEAEKNSFRHRGGGGGGRPWNSLSNAVKGQTSLKLFLSH